MNIYFFGGTFDPPHKAHKLIYKYCMDFCDQFIFVPTAQSPGKINPMINSDKRIQMLELLIDDQDFKKVVIDKFEIDSNKSPSYTIDTIYYLKEKFKNASITMVIGLDQYNNLNNWKDYNQIINEVEIICFNRGKTKLDYNSNINLIDFNQEISSTEIKQHIENARIDKAKKYLTKEVSHFIIKNGLYAN